MNVQDLVEINDSLHAGMWFSATYAPPKDADYIRSGLTRGGRYIGKVMFGGGFDVLLNSGNTQFEFRHDFKDFVLHSVADPRLGKTKALNELARPERPLFVLHRPVAGRSVPSMKNDNQVNRITGKVRRSPETRSFIMSLRNKIAKNMKTMGFDETPAEKYVSIVAYIRATNQDLDNMYTSVQEAFQSTKSVKGFVANDNQVKAFHPIYAAKRRMEEPLVLCFAWVSGDSITEDKDLSSEEYIRWYNTIWKGQSLEQIVRIFGV